MSTKSTGSGLTRLPLAVYAWFKSVNFFKYYKQKIYNFGGGPYWWGPGAMAPWTSLNPAVRIISACGSKIISCQSQCGAVSIKFTCCQQSWLWVTSDMTVYFHTSHTSLLLTLIRLCWPVFVFVILYINGRVSVCPSMCVCMCVLNRAETNFARRRTVNKNPETDTVNNKIKIIELWKVIPKCFAIS